MKNQLLSSILLLTAACASDDPATQPELGVSTSSSVRVIRERAVDVVIEIVRSDDLEGPVTISVDDLPAGVFAVPLEIAEGETKGVLKLFAVDGIALGERTNVTVRATAGDTVAMTAMELRLTDRPGSLDKTFATGGMAYAHYSTIHQEMLSLVAVQPDGKIVAAGMNFDFSVMIVTRFNPDGSVDKDFGDGGTYPGPVTSEALVGMTVRPDGAILLVGAEDKTTNIRVLSPQGHALETIVLSAANVGGDFSARSTVGMPDGSMYIAGPRALPSGVTVVRLGTDGKLDTAFDQDGVAAIATDTAMEPLSLMRHSDGRLWMTGYAPDASATMRFAAARLNADGSADNAFSGDGYQRYDMLPEGGIMMASLLPDGRVAAVGVDSAQAISMATIELDGSIDMAKAVPMNMSPFKAASVTGGVIVVGTSNTSATDWAVTKFGATGTLETNFGTDGVMATHAPTGGAHLLLGGVGLDQDRAYVVGANHVDPMSSPTRQALLRIWL